MIFSIFLFFLRFFLLFFLLFYKRIALGFFLPILTPVLSSLLWVNRVLFHVLQSFFFLFHSTLGDLLGRLGMIWWIQEPRWVFRLLLNLILMNLTSPVNFTHLLSLEISFSLFVCQHLLSHYSSAHTLKPALNHVGWRMQSDHHFILMSPLFFWVLSSQLDESL